MVHINAPPADKQVRLHTPHQQQHDEDEEKVQKVPSHLGQCLQDDCKPRLEGQDHKKPAAGSKARLGTVKQGAVRAKDGGGPRCPGLQVLIGCRGKNRVSHWLY